MSDTSSNLPRLRLNYADMWAGHDPVENFFTNLLSRRYTVEISEDPELVVHSCFGTTVRTYSCRRLFVCWENRGWTFADTDAAITSDFNSDPRHYRFPLFGAHLGHPFLQPPVDPASALASKSSFATVVVSNGEGATRNRIHDLLNSYKPVSSGGRYRNNIGGPVDDKMAFIRESKFHLAFENSAYPGYLTEKLLHGLQAESIPIYWGDPHVAAQFNSRRFLDLRSFDDDQDLLRRIRQLDTDDAAYQSVLAEPWFRDGRLPNCADQDLLLDFIRDVVCSTARPASSRPRFSAAAMRMNTRRVARRRRLRRTT